MKKFHFLVLFSLLLSVPQVSAEELNYNLVQLYGNAEKQIDNDVLIVTMNASAEANSARDASQSVNLDMDWAIKQSKKITSIKNQTMNYQTRPRYDKKAIVGWYASQQLRLESSSIEELSNLIGTLQGKLSVNSMRFMISTDRKKIAIDELTTQALDTFRAKALLVVKTIGAKDYRLVNISIGENSPHTPYDRGFQAEAMSLAKTRAPAVQAGESKINVRVDGTIQLIF